MSLEQRPIPLEFLDGARWSAIASGSQAAWQCRCGRPTWFLGRAGFLDRVTEGYAVPCPDCHRVYCVVPEDHDRGRAARVREVDPASLDT